MGHMNFGAYTSKARKATVKIVVSGFSWCQLNCISTHTEAHNGLVCARNKTLVALDSETMVPAHSDSTPGRPAPFTTTHALVLLFP